uniref:NADH-ubiquinone oxidoreductase chain 1 n=1 Tax=Nesodiprion biremis TaxID=2950363 RepID=A0A977XSY6_9HYME|nr:NADH dehydrogenase subunit 1 [Nesodiprion biremis]UXW93528.1 NADH dehydrogenase subunit 1 [Nesodiprion biremis]
MYLNEVYMIFLSSLILLIMVLLSVAFLTLLERKVLGLIQIRKGPNKVSIIGILQPFSDAIKLFSKEYSIPLMSNFLPYFFSPLIMLMLMLICWMTMPYVTNFYSFNLSVIFFLCCLSMGVYPVMISGWSSNSKYSFLGMLRTVAQTISYEVSLVMVILSFMFLIEGYSMIYFNLYQNFIWFFFFTFPLNLIWFIICLAETNRTPFDFSEGESELVSGFNIEYSGVGFSLIFLSEYSSILFMSMLFVLMFLGGDLMNFIFYLMMIFISFLFILIRGTLPRLRYDKLMMMAWKKILPVSLNYLILFLGLKFMFNCMIV